MQVTHSDSYKNGSNQQTVNLVNFDVEGFGCKTFYTVIMNGTPGQLIHPAFNGLMLEASGEFQVKFADLQKLSSWNDRSIWCGGSWDKTWHNITAETHNSKMRPVHYFSKYGRMSATNISPVQLYVPFADATLDECALHVLIQHGDLPLVVNGEVHPGGSKDPMQVQAEFFPKLLLSGPPVINDNGGVVTAQLVGADGSPLARDTTIYIEPVSGYVAKQRLALVNGTGSFRVLPLGLDAGEHLRIKAGWRYFTGAADFYSEVA